MPFNNNQNQRSRFNNINVNTTLVTMTCAMYHDQLRLKAWNRNLSMTLCPVISQTNGVYEYESEDSKCVKTSLTLEKCIMLEKLYDKILAPAIASGQSKSVSVMVQQSNSNNGYGGGYQQQGPPLYKVITLGYDGTNEYLRITGNVSENGVGSMDNTYTHVFAKREGYEDYDILTGQRVSHNIETDFERFIMILRSVKNFGPEIAHGIKLDNAYKSSGSNSSSSGGWGSNNGYQNGNGGGYNSGMNTPSYGSSSSAPMSMDGMNDYLPFK